MLGFFNVLTSHRDIIYKLRLTINRIRRRSYCVNLKTTYMVNYTLDELADFSRLEQELIDNVMGIENKTPLLSPSKKIITNVLGYSKALSVKSSKYLDQTEMVLN